MKNPKISKKVSIFVGGQLRELDVVFSAGEPPVARNGSVMMVVLYVDALSFAYVRSYMPLMPLTHVQAACLSIHHIFPTASFGTQKGNVIVMTNRSRCFRLARLYR